MRPGRLFFLTRRPSGHRFLLVVKIYCWPRSTVHLHKSNNCCPINDRIAPGNRRSELRPPPAPAIWGCMQNIPLLPRLTRSRPFSTRACSGSERLFRRHRVRVPVGSPIHVIAYRAARMWADFRRQPRQQRRRNHRNRKTWSGRSRTWP